MQVLNFCFIHGAKSITTAQFKFIVKPWRNRSQSPNNEWCTIRWVKRITSARFHLAQSIRLHIWSCACSSWWVESQGCCLYRCLYVLRWFVHLLHAREKYEIVGFIPHIAWVGIRHLSWCFINEATRFTNAQFEVMMKWLANRSDWLDNQSNTKDCTLLV